MLNGTALPAGTYTITANSATLAGSGQTTSPNFTNSVSITATDGTLELGPASGTLNVNSGATSLAPNSGVTLDGYSGTIGVSDNINGTDAVTFSGNATNVLQVSASPAALTTNENTPVAFTANIATSLADTYNITAQAPAGWTVVVSDTGGVTVTPAPGVQGGTYPIQLTVQSSMDPNLVANAVVNVTITPTAPGMTLAVDPNTVITVPYNGAQVPTSFQAVIDNTGPAADTYNLTFPTVPAGFTVLNSDTSATIPAGATGILGIYLQPSGTLPLPGTAESFSVTATSTTTSSITQTVTETFDMPPVYAVTVTDNPTSLNTTPGAPVQTTLTITNVGNETYDAAVSPTLPSGWTISGGNTPVSLAVGASTSETVTITPPANAPLNSLQNVTLAYGQGAAQNAVSVTAVTPNPSTVEAGTPVDVTAGILAGVTQAEQGTVSYSVTTSQGTINSTPVAISLPEVIGLSTIDLGNLNTANLSPGTYTINVTVDDAGGNVIATGQGELFVDAPIAATQSLSTSTLAPTSGTVTNTLSIAAQAQLGQVATDSQAASVVTSGNYAYSIGTSDITIVNVSNPSSPTVVGTFGSGTLNSVSTNLGGAGRQRPGRGLVHRQRHVQLPGLFPGQSHEPDVVEQHRDQLPNRGNPLQPFCAGDDGLRGYRWDRLVRRRPEHDHRPERRSPGHRLQHSGQPQRCGLADQQRDSSQRRHRQHQRRRGSLKLLGL